MNLIDTHTHLFLEEFREDIDAVIKKSVEKGINEFYLPNIDSTSIDAMLTLCNTYPDVCFPMIGLHPCSVNKDFEKELNIVEQWLEKRKFYGIGETGIDLYWDRTFEKEQKISFRRQAQLAKKHHLPLIIHTRNAFNEAFEIVAEENSDELKGVFHCFSGTIEDAEKVISLGGFKIGIGGVVTFKNSGLDKVVRDIPLEHLVLETDSPYLAPAPYRGKRNESSYLTIIAEKIAELHQVPVETVARITTENAGKLFHH
jgi:TatD DNase family protein